jgi:DNA-binding transcriptional regulator YdaS (Cro superfamily)
MEVTMRLDEWIKSACKTQTEAAQILGISQPFVSLLISGERIASDEIAVQIEEATGGAVTFLELKHPKFRAASSG